MGVLRKDRFGKIWCEDSETSRPACLFCAQESEEEGVFWAGWNATRLTPALFRGETDHIHLHEGCARDLIHQLSKDLKRLAKLQHDFFPSYDDKGE